MNAEAGPGSESSVGADDAWLDEALAQSFPASDPISRFHGETMMPANRDQPLIHLPSTSTLVKDLAIGDEGHDAFTL